jgi:hypothetical protein
MLTCLDRGGSVCVRLCQTNWRLEYRLEGLVLCSCFIFKARLGQDEGIQHFERKIFISRSFSCREYY